MAGGRRGLLLHGAEQARSAPRLARRRARVWRGAWPNHRRWPGGGVARDRESSPPVETTLASRGRRRYPRRFGRRIGGTVLAVARHAGERNCPLGRQGLSARARVNGLPAPSTLLPSLHRGRDGCCRIQGLRGRTRCCTAALVTDVPVRPGGVAVWLRQLIRNLPGVDFTVVRDHADGFGEPVVWEFPSQRRRLPSARRGIG